MRLNYLCMLALGKHSKHRTLKPDGTRTRLRVPHRCPIQTHPKPLQIRLNATCCPAVIQRVLMHAHKKVGYNVCPSASSSVRASDEPYIPATVPWPEVGSVRSGHTFTGRCADARTLVESARACAGGRAVDETDSDGDGGGSVAGS